MTDRTRHRRAFLGGVGAIAASALTRGVSAQDRRELVTGTLKPTYDAVVVGAGCFGAWTAWHLRKAGLSVLLLDRYGAANARASSAGESRIIRMSYGPDEVYTRFSHRSLGLWKSFFDAVGRSELFQPTGVLWIARDEDPTATASLRTLAAMGIRHERFDAAALHARYPQMETPPGAWAIWEPESGVLLARRAVQAVVADAVRNGVDYAIADVQPPQGTSRLTEVRAADGRTVRSDHVVFACGPWLGKAVPSALEGRIFPTRQQVIFFGVPPGDPRFGPPAMPTWIHYDGGFYGMPDIEARGFKVAADGHGPPFDPDRGERVVTADAILRARAFLARRFPALKDAPVVETRVCQYENTSSGDFVIDRHPDLENVWVAGGGSGHGFKHGPAVGEYTAARVLNRGEAEARFSLESKKRVQKRVVQ
ncbi:MAG: FAD-dependent oxidoreductase [Vicinamibacterales bacterium]